MQRIKAIFRLLRMPNLVIIASVLYLQRFCIVLPFLQLSGIYIAWSGYHLVVFGTVLIAAGGYLINDYFDIEIDEVNKPDKALALHSISLATIKRVYFAVSVAGLASIAMACHISGAYILWFVYLIATLVLLWYSYHLKKVLLLGNIAVAMASAFTLPAAWLFDLMTLPGWSSINFNTGNIYYIMSVRVIIYSLFAFLISFAREVIKDIEDMEGDSRFGCKSLPVVYGVPVAKRIIIACFVSILAVLLLWQIELFKSAYHVIAIYLAIAVDLPLAGLAVYVFRMQTKANSHKAGLITKLIMVTGILSMLLFLL
jgi:4-hydroxybenzoate polyprenyltransferase